MGSSFAFSTTGKIERAEDFAGALPLFQIVDRLIRDERGLIADFVDVHGRLDEVSARARQVEEADHRHHDHRRQCVQVEPS